MSEEVVKKMASTATISQSNGSNNHRFRTNPKHFLTWSANAANHKIQKLSKNFVQNVSKFHNKMEKALSHQHNNNSNQSHQEWDPSCIDNNENESDINTTAPTTISNKCISSENNAFESIEDKYSHLLANNNVNVAIVHNLNLHKNKSLVNCPNNLNNCDGGNNNGNEWTSICRTRKKFDFEIEKTKLAQSFKDKHHNHENIVVDMLELGQFPIGKCLDDENEDDDEHDEEITKCLNDSNNASKDEIQLVIGTYNLNTSSSSNNTSLSTISIGGITTTTVPINSPHWSRSSSMSNSGEFHNHNHNENNNNICHDSGGNKSNNLSNSHHTNTNRIRNIKQSFISPTINLKRQNDNNHSERLKNESCPNITNKSEGIIENRNNHKNHKNQGKTVCPDDLSTSTCTSTISLLQSKSQSKNQRGHNNHSSSSSTSASSLSLVEVSQNSSSGLHNNNDSTTSKSSKSMIELLGHRHHHHHFDHPIPIATSTPSKLAVTTFEESELRHAPWFQAGLPREIALEVLKNEPIGSFIVRESTTKSGCFALSIRVPREFQPSGIAHYLILKTGRGYKIKGFTKEFGSLTSLITHHSVMPELLPCPLSLHLYKPTAAVHISRLESADFVEPEKLVTTFRKYTDF